MYSSYSVLEAHFTFDSLSHRCKINLNQENYSVAEDKEFPNIMSVSENTGQNDVMLSKRDLPLLASFAQGAIGISKS